MPVYPEEALKNRIRGNVVLRVVPMLAIGAAAGAFAASAVVSSIRNDVLVRVFAAFLLVNSVHTWLRASGVSAQTARA